MSQLHSELSSVLTSSNRPSTTVMALNGMVSSPHYLASQAGLTVLAQGGNAVEAAIATAATLAVVYPHMNAIGGDNFWLIYNAATGDLKGLAAAGAAGEKVTIEAYRAQGYEQIPARGYLAANTVPGAIAGWQAAYDYGQQQLQGKLSWRTLLTSAIDYAEAGFPVSVNQSQWLQTTLNAVDPTFADLKQFKGFRSIFFKPNGEPYETGEILQQQALADTLKRVSEHGAAEFYIGKTAQKIVADLQAHGGLLTLNDFARHAARWVDPISVNYRGIQAYNLPPPTQGIASLQILSILDHFDVKQLGEGTADYYHLIVEATKLAFADRDRWVTDPDFSEIPLAELLSRAHNGQLAAQIDMQCAKRDGGAIALPSDTVWLGIVDQAGNAVSLIQSIADGFGSGIVADGTGVLLQNRGKFFSLNPNHVNSLAPHKRSYHTLNPAMLFRQGKPSLIYGTMGGDGQPQTQAALVTRVVDFNLPAQAAIEAPRWIQGRNLGSQTHELKIEGRVPPTVLGNLQRRGHTINVQPDFTDVVGQAGMIVINPDSGVRSGGADPRGEGLAMGH